MIKHNKAKVIKVLNNITKMAKSDNLIHEVLGQDFCEEYEHFWYLDYYATLDAVHVLFTGEGHRTTYDKFKTCSYDKVDKPVGWYTTEFNSKADGSIAGPRNYTGFIPDQIQGVIHSILPGKEKYELLHIMFSDLDRLEKEFKSDS